MSEDAVAEETAETAQDAGTPVEDALDAVSYTHLTLPTKRIV